MTSRIAQRRESARRADLAIAKAGRDAEARRRRRRAAVAAIIAAVFVVAVAIVSGSGGGPATAANGDRVADAAYSRALLAGIPQRRLVLGSADAPVRIVEFADLQCPYCDEFATQALPSLITHYIRPGKVSIEFRNLSFIGAASVRAGLTAAGAEQQNKLWNFVDLMYLNQGEENSGYVTNAYLHRLLAAIPSLDVARAERASQTQHATEVLAAANAAASADGINATPSFLVGHPGGALRVFQPDSLTAGPFAHEFDSLLASR